MPAKKRKSKDFTQLPYVHFRQLELLQKALAPWPRRAAPLLMVNCGDGFFLPFLWQSGFDAIATEPEPKLRASAFRQSVPGLEIHAAREDDLPFEDDSFDWVVLRLRQKEEAAAGAREALRVSRRGLMILFWNSASLPLWLIRKKYGKEALPPGCGCFWRIWQQAKSLRVGRQTALSTLAGPLCTWKEGGLLERINGWAEGPFGAWGIIRIDLAAADLATPLAQRIEEAFNPPHALMEYSPKKQAINFKNDKKP